MRPIQSNKRCYQDDMSTTFEEEGSVPLVDCSIELFLYGGQSDLDDDFFFWREALLDILLHSAKKREGGREKEGEKEEGRGVKWGRKNDSRGEWEKR